MTLHGTGHILFEKKKGKATCRTVANLYLDNLKYFSIHFKSNTLSTYQHKFSI